MKTNDFLSSLKKGLKNIADLTEIKNESDKLIFYKQKAYFLDQKDMSFKIKFHRNSILLIINDEKCRQSSNFIFDDTNNKLKIIFDDCKANKPKNDKIRKKRGLDSKATNLTFLKKHGYSKPVGNVKHKIEICSFKDFDKDFNKIILGLYNWGKTHFYIREEKRGNDDVSINKNVGVSNNSTNHITKTLSNLILYGPPGTGKTYRTIDLAEKIIKNEDYMSALECDENKHEENTKEFNKKLHKQIHFITFHQNYSYEEFVGGLRPDETSGTLKFKWVPGIFLKACAEAFKQTGIAVPSTEIYKADDIDKFLSYCEFPYNFEEFKKAPKVVLIIDEINRANISRVFGELITLIEDDKRIGGKHQLILRLPNGRKFGVPANLVIIGTMNTADKSIALLDIALRRRFEFVQMEVNSDLVEKNKNLLEAINKKIEEKKGNQDFNIGHSYFMKKTDDDKEIDVIEVMNKKIIPLLYEYFMGDKNEVKEVLENAITSTSELKLINQEEKNYSILRVE